METKEELETFQINDSTLPKEILERYWITKNGKIWDFDQNKYKDLYAKNNKNLVRFRYKGRAVERVVSKLVAMTFMDGIYNWTKLKHKGELLDDSVENLYWDIEGLKNRKVDTTKCKKFYILTYNDYTYKDYKIAKDGDLRRGKQIIPSYVSRDGYHIVNISKDNKSSSVFLHKILSQMFLENPENCEFVEYIDGNKNNVNVSNLRWISKDKWKKNISDNVKKTTKKYDKLAKRAVLQIDISTGKIINNYNSISEAARVLNCDRSGIGKVCREKGQTYAGFKWKYDTNPTPIESEINKGIFYGIKTNNVDLANAVSITKNYYIFSNGEVYNLNTKRYIKPINKNGYRIIRIIDDNCKKNLVIHQEVIKAFGQYENIEGFEIDHINKIRHDNRIENLQVVTASENVKRAHLTTKQCIERSKTYNLTNDI